MDNRELFKGTATYYAKYRPGYPPAFFEFLRKEFKLNGTGRLLDLGCGTGQITVPLAKDFEKVVALDPDREMLAEARRQAKRVRATNIKWVLGKAEEMRYPASSFRLVTLGASFHWMNRQANVLRTIYRLLERGGGIVLVHNPSSGWRKQNEKWKAVRKQVVQKYLGKRRRAGNSLYREKDAYWEDVLDASPFGGHKTWRFKYPLSWTTEGVIRYLYSTSFASRRLFGKKLPMFEKELKEKLWKLKPSGIFKESVKLEALVARKR